MPEPIIVYFVVMIILIVLIGIFHKEITNDSGDDILFAIFAAIVWPLALAAIFILIGVYTPFLFGKLIRRLFKGNK
jgi:hypothetical protein